MDTDQFQGVRYELFVAATCIRAGFDIAYEDETDKTKKHPEFVATHRLTGQKISVEAKRRHRQDILGFNSQKESEPLIKVRKGRHIKKENYLLKELKDLKK